MHSLVSYYLLQTSAAPALIAQYKHRDLGACCLEWGVGWVKKFKSYHLFVFFWISLILISKTITRQKNSPIQTFILCKMEVEQPCISYMYL